MWKIEVSWRFHLDMFILFRIYFVSCLRVKVISIVEAILALPSPSLGGISWVPMVILPMLSSFMSLRLVISTVSMAVVVACPFAFGVTFLFLDPLKLVVTPNT